MTLDALQKVAKAILLQFDRAVSMFVDAVRVLFNDIVSEMQRCEKATKAIDFAKWEENTGAPSSRTICVVVLVSVSRCHRATGAHQPSVS